MSGGGADWKRTKGLKVSEMNAPDMTSSSYSPPEHTMSYKPAAPAVVTESRCVRPVLLRLRNYAMHVCNGCIRVSMHGWMNGWTDG